MIKCVIFDLDGTLIDSSEGITKSTQYALATYGIEEPDLSKLKVFIGPPLSYSFSKYYGFDEAKAREAVDRYRVRYKKLGIFECSLYPGVVESLEKLKEKGFLIGIGSSKPENSCVRILEYFDILKYFDYVVGSTEDGRIDTKEEVLNELFSRIGDIRKEEMCLVGDTIFDIEGANKVGIASIGVSFGFGNTREMHEAGAIAICDSMSDVTDTVIGIK